jgi:hypothetical protein
MERCRFLKQHRKASRAPVECSEYLQLLKAAVHDAKGFDYRFPNDRVGLVVASARPNWDYPHSIIGG